MTKPIVGLIMGSQSDWQTMREASVLLDELGVAHEARIVSAADFRSSLPGQAVPRICPA